MVRLFIECKDKNAKRKFKGKIFGNWTPIPKSIGETWDELIDTTKDDLYIFKVKCDACGKKHMYNVSQVRARISSIGISVFGGLIGSSLAMYLSENISVLSFFFIGIVLSALIGGGLRYLDKQEVYRINKKAKKFYLIDMEYFDKIKPIDKGESGPYKEPIRPCPDCPLKLKEDFATEPVKE